MAGGFTETFLLFVISRHFPHQTPLTFNNRHAFDIYINSKRNKPPITAGITAH
jgi:hypothetical protein